MIVVDASVAVKWFVEEDDHLSALSLLDHNNVLIAPDLIFSETANVLWKKLRKSEVTLEQSRRACEALPGFFQGIVGAVAIAADALELAKRIEHSVYDCIYLACAQRCGAKLVTADKRFLSRTRNAGLSHLASGLSDFTTNDQTGASLSISDRELSRVLGLSDRFQRTLSFVEDHVKRPIGGGALKWVNTADLGSAFESPALRRLEHAIEGLPASSLCDIVALAWLGRGYDGRNWDDLRKSAEGLLASNPLQHNRYIISLLSYVQAGMGELTKIQAQQANLSEPGSKGEK